jgi:fused signal recognition particle receptor
MIYLILIAAVVVFGAAVLIVSRRRAARQPLPPALPTQPASSAPAPPVPEREDREATPGAPGAPPAAADVLAPAEVAVPTPDETAVPTPDETAPAAPEVAAPHAEPEAEPQPAGFRDRLGRARAALAGVFSGVRTRGGITPDTWDDLEEALLKADVGVRVSNELLDGLRAWTKANKVDDPDALLDELRREMIGRLDGADRELHLADTGTNVWLFVGVNGVGKTTTIGKVGAQQAAAGRSVVMAAGDTFRAAAAEQLDTWARRCGAELVRGNEGGDPSAVIFDAVQRAAARGNDLVLADTAGRLQNKSNLMEELRKVRRVAGREPGTVSEVLLVIDATTGQNGLAQAREFGEATGVTGVVLTKLDGSAKGGIVFAIETELGLPVKLVGLGETIGDLVPFGPTEFVNALF